jgi:hypothetical protein
MAVFMKSASRSKEIQAADFSCQVLGGILHATRTLNSLAFPGVASICVFRAFFCGRSHQRWFCSPGLAGLCTTALPGTKPDVDARLLGVW